MFPSKPLSLTRKFQSPIAYGDADGAVMPHAGRYARECVLTAFEMIGGVERMADWANKNPEAFYTKLLTKVITREVEMHASEGVEDLLRRLDAESASATPGAYDNVEEADYELMDSPM